MHQHPRSQDCALKSMPKSRTTMGLTPARYRSAESRGASASAPPRHTTTVDSLRWLGDGLNSESCLRRTAGGNWRRESPSRQANEQERVQAKAIVGGERANTTDEDSGCNGER